MAEGMMNPNTQEQLMLVQSFEQLADAVGAEIPVSIESKMAAVKNGMRMSPALQRILAEGNMKFMNQLSPDQMGSVPQGIGTNPDIMKAPAIRDSNMGSVSDAEMRMMQDGAQGMAPAAPAQGMGAMSDREMDGSYQVDGGIEQMTPAEFAAAVQSGQITPDELMMESSGSTMTPAERQMMEEEAYFKRLMEEQQALPRMAPEPATPQMRPRPRPTAPMQSPRPQMRR